MGAISFNRNVSMLTKNDYKKICRQLNELGFKSYSEFLSSNLWKEFRAVLYKKDKPVICSICKNRSDLLFLHHMTYKRMLDPRNLRWVCKDCHSKVHLENNQTIQDETDALITALNGKHKRTESLRIVSSSNLPETLHHSLHACGVISKIRQGDSAKVSLEDYYNRKLKKKDSLMIELLEKNFIDALEYLSTFTTR